MWNIALVNRLVFLRVKGIGEVPVGKLCWSQIMGGLECKLNALMFYLANSEPLKG